MIKAGRVEALPLSGVLGKNKDGKPRAAVQFEITEPGDDCGKTIIWYGNLSGKGAEYTKSGLEACGWDGKNIMDFYSETGEGVKPAGFGDHKVALVISHWTNNEGKVNAQVNFVNPIGASMLRDKNKMDKAEAMALAASLGQTVVEDPSEKKVDVPF